MHKESRCRTCVVRNVPYWYLVEGQSLNGYRQHAFMPCVVIAGPREKGFRIPRLLALTLATYRRTTAAREDNPIRLMSTQNYHFTDPTNGTMVIFLK